MTSFKRQWLHSSVGWSVAPVSRGHGFPVEVLNFFRLLYAVAKIASITARIIALLDFLSAVQYMIHFYHFVHRFYSNTRRFYLSNGAVQGRLTCQRVVSSQKLHEDTRIVSGDWRITVCKLRGKSCV